jgi:beta-lactamase regulating signal transducer with metallopeptidase domain
MNCTLFANVRILGVPSQLLLDSAVKGTALLVLAAFAVTILRRDSAATRHLVWLLAIVAVLVVPLLSALLPQWRVLPKWAGDSPQPVVAEIGPLKTAIPVTGTGELPQMAEPVAVEQSSSNGYQPVVDFPDSRPARATPEIVPESEVETWNWLNALPLVWAIGFSVLILRLLAARWMLWNTERQGRVVGSSRPSTKETHDPLLITLQTACLHFAIGRPVTLLIHPDKTIPVVWGILRYRLLLPTSAREWSGEQSRSVLLHELAHIQRRDTMAQLLTQFACALHWFNPLVWFAAWRLDVERERACDDLVLRSGVRPSAYAGHLLESVTGHSPSRWTSPCGLAIARKSSLECRLVAVLRVDLNRRRVPHALAAFALAISAGITVSVAMLRAAEESPRTATTQANDDDPPSAGAVLAAPVASQQGQQPSVMSAKPLAEREIVFITRETQRRFPKFDTGDGVTLEIHGHVFHGTDVQTSVRIRWPPRDEVVLGHDESIAVDAFANREKWALGWVRGTKTFWYVRNDLDGRVPSNSRLHRTTFEKPRTIVTDYDANYPGEPIEGLGLPPELRAKFETYFGLTQPKVVDKSGGLPDVRGQFVHSAQPVKSDGSLPEDGVRPANDRRWKVQFVDRDSGQPAPGVRVRLHVQNANGSESYDVVRVVSGDEGMAPVLGANHFATVEVVDDHYRGGGGSRVFGNVPADWLAAEKHTDPEKPFVVKVWPTSRDPQPADDALWNTKTPFERIPVAITNWSPEQNGLRLGMRVVADEGWRAGGKVKVELWLHNPSEKDVWFVAHPNRSDVGLAVAAQDCEGQDHFAENGNVMIIAVPIHCVLPAGHVAKVKDFNLTFGAPDNRETASFQPKFRELKAGIYTLRCQWSDAHPLVSGDGEWTGFLTTGEQTFRL